MNLDHLNRICGRIDKQVGLQLEGMGLQLEGMLHWGLGGELRGELLRHLDNQLNDPLEQFLTEPEDPWPAPA